MASRERTSFRATKETCIKENSRWRLAEACGQSGMDHLLRVNAALRLLPTELQILKSKPTEKDRYLVLLVRWNGR